MTEKLRAILDTNVYGWIIAYDKSLIQRLIESKTTRIYGFEIIRKELRATPTTSKTENINTRIALLQLYDELVKNHDYNSNDIIEQLANSYSRVYTGGIAKEKLWKDFLIVACASIHQLDIIVTGDNHSMRSTPSIKAYEKVNREKELSLPKFYSISEVKPLL